LRTVLKIVGTASSRVTDAASDEAISATGRTSEHDVAAADHRQEVGVPAIHMEQRNDMEDDIRLGEGQPICAAIAGTAPDGSS
jgi:hypothetical protein